MEYEIVDITNITPPVSGSRASYGELKEFCKEIAVVLPQIPIDKAIRVKMAPNRRTRFYANLRTFTLNFTTSYIDGYLYIYPVGRKGNK